jgi:preprotein translocase subunit SecB
VVCPRVLLPYAREAVSAVMQRAGLPPIILPHVGFESIYEERQQEQQGQQGPQAASPPPTGK